MLFVFIVARPFRDGSVGFGGEKMVRASDICTFAEEVVVIEVASFICFPAWEVYVVFLAC